ncbi:MAG: DUF1648 domain-containing protein [Candidatus Acidiferrum sp.]
MQDSRVPKTIFSFLAAAGAVQALMYYPQLPRTIASHFSGGGHPNGWQSKPVFFLFFLFSMVIAAFVSFVVPRAFSSLPASQLNLPSKDFWLAPENREGTFRFLEIQLAWFGCVLLAFLLFSFHVAIRVNLSPGSSFDSRSFVFGLGVFFIFVIVWMIRFVGHFVSPEK